MSAPVIYYIYYAFKKRQQKEKYKHLFEINKQKSNEAKQKVFEAIKLLKERGEKITIRKVKEVAGVGIATASKYVKEAREKGII